MKVIIDTDPGLDDTEAIIYALSCKDIDVLAFTAVAGNANFPVVSDNLRRALSFLGHNDIPVFEGGSYNLLGKYIKTDDYFGKNAFANIELPESNIQADKSMHASQALVDITKKNRGQVHVICLGPITNVALAFLLDNQFPSYCAGIYIIGGDRDDITYKNATPYADFNFWCDPLAARILADCFTLPNNSPIILIDWHLCWHSLLSMDMFDRMFGPDRSNKTCNKYVELMSIIRDFTNEICSRSVWEEGFLTADLFPTMVCHDPKLIKSARRVRISDIVLEGERAGATTFTDDPNGNFLMVDQIDVKEMADKIVRSLLSNRQ